MVLIICAAADCLCFRSVSVWACQSIREHKCAVSQSIAESSVYSPFGPSNKDTSRDACSTDLLCMFDVIQFDDCVHPHSILMMAHCCMDDHPSCRYMVRALTSSSSRSTDRRTIGRPCARASVMPTNETTLSFMFPVHCGPLSWALALTLSFSSSAMSSFEYNNRN